MLALSVDNKTDNSQFIISVSCSNIILPQVLQERILCLTTSCPPPDPLQEEEVWPDWVRPVLCVSIVIVAIAFIAFMKFGQSWFEGSITVIVDSERERVKL